MAFDPWVLGSHFFIPPPLMTFFLAREDNAQSLLGDPRFLENWESIFEACPWATVFQSPVYLKIWEECYRSRYEIAFIGEEDEAGRLQGLFVFAICRESGAICPAGDYHSEYQTWLSLPSEADIFPEKLFDQLQSVFPGGKISFLFLASGSPLKWLGGKWGKQSCLRQMPRPLVKIGDGSEAEGSLRKKGNRTRIRQLSKAGKIELLELNDPALLKEVFDEIEGYSKLRMSALHDVAPGFDPHRKDFHLALGRNTGLLYGTLLKAGGKIASAQICIRNRNEMLLCITAMSPFFAAQSPSKIHLLLLEKEFSRRGIEIFDLSPGEGYKDRFASSYDDAHALTIYFDRKDFIKDKASKEAKGILRRSLEKLKLEKTGLFKFADKASHKLKRVKYRTIPATIYKNLKRRLFERLECRLYSFAAEKIKDLPEISLMKRNSIADLLQYEPSEGWQFTRSQFHKVVLGRFEEGTIVYTYAEKGKLLHSGWLLEKQEVGRLTDVDAEYRFPPNTAVLFDFYTHPEARGKGLYQKSLTQMLRAAAEIPGIEQVFIAVMAENGPSRHVIEKVGFEYKASLFRETRFGRSKSWLYSEE